MCHSLVIFGCGYVGKALARMALENGLRVTALTRNAEAADDLRTLGVGQVIEAELDSSDWHREIDPNQHWVINTVSSAGGGMAGYQKSYLEGQRSIVQWASQGSVDVFMYTSSSSVYPQSDGAWVDESSSTVGGSDCGNILLAAEQAVQECQAFKKAYILRLSGIYGPERHHFLSQLSAGERVFSGMGNQYLNMIHLDDICAAIWFLYHHRTLSESGIYNVTDDSKATKEMVVNWLAKRLEFEQMPIFDARIPGRRAGSQAKPVSGRTANRRIANTKLKALGWSLRYPTFREGYEAILNALSQP